MATDTETLTAAIKELSAKLTPLGQFVDQWQMRERSPGLYSKFAVASPFRPFANQCHILHVTPVNVVSDHLSNGFYHLMATVNCFIALNNPANVNGAGTNTISSYPIVANLVYGPFRIADQDKLNAIGIGVDGFLYFCPVE